MDEKQEASTSPALKNTKINEPCFAVQDIHGHKPPGPM
jgi:hypothetical protein